MYIKRFPIASFSLLFELSMGKNTLQTAVRRFISGKHMKLLSLNPRTLSSFSTSDNHQHQLSKIDIQSDIFDETDENTFSPNGKKFDLSRRLVEERNYEVCFFRWHCLSKDFFTNAETKVDKVDPLSKEEIATIDELFMRCIQGETIPSKSVEYFERCVNDVLKSCPDDTTNKSYSTPLRFLLKLFWIGTFAHSSATLPVLCEFSRKNFLHKLQTPIDEYLNLMMLLTLHSRLNETESDHIQTFTINHNAEMSVTDLSVVSYCLFRNELFIKYGRVLEVFANTTMKLLREFVIEKRNDESYTITSLLKSIGFIQGILPISVVVQFSTCLAELPFEQFCALPPTVLNRYCRWVLKLDYKHPELTDRIKKSIESGQLRIKRLKDLVSILAYLARVDYAEKSTIDLIKTLQSKHRHELFYQKNDGFVCFFVETAIRVGVFDDQLINVVLGDQFIQYVLKTLPFTFPANQLQFIDMSTAIERPRYNGNRISQMMVPIIERGKLNEIKLSPHSIEPSVVVLQNVRATLCQLMHFQEDNFFIGPVLPHFLRPNMVLRFKKPTLECLPPFKKIQYRSNLTFDDLKVPNDETWICFMIRDNRSLLRQAQILNGHYACQMRQLLCLGYKIALINGRQNGRVLGQGNPDSIINNLNQLIVNDKLLTFTFIR